MSDHETTLREAGENGLDRYARPAVVTETLARACLAGADALRRGTWQPIATMPQEGTCVLLWDASRRFITLGSRRDCSGPGWSATHWMPLPDAPTEPTR